MFKFSKEFYEKYGLGGEIFFLRHGESLWNQKGLCQGHRDIDLSDHGKKETFTCGKNSAHLLFTAIYSSPLLRALRTATIIHRFHPTAHFEVLDDLKERGFGKLEGKSNREMYDLERKEEEDPSFISDFNIEQRMSFNKRVVRGVNAALRFDSDKPENPLQRRVLIVSHGRVFLSLCEALNLPRVRQIPNLSLVKLSKDKWKWKLITIF